MKQGLSIFKQQLDQEKNKRAPTDKRLLQRDLVSLKKDGFVYLSKLSEKKVELMNFDNCLEKLNPHQHQKTEQLNKHILQVQILGGVKQPEELEKLESFIKAKADQKYQEQVATLNNGNEFEKKHPLFLEGKRRLEDLKIEEEKKAFVKIHRFGALLSALKKNLKYLQYSQPEQNSEVQNTTKSKQEFQNEGNASQFQVEINEAEPKLSTQFLTVFKKDESLNQEKIKALFPQINFETLRLEKNIDPSLLTVEQPKQSTIAPLKLNKVQFNSLVKHVIYEAENEEIEETESIFKRIDQFNESISRRHYQDKVTEKKIEIVSEEERIDQKWSQNQFDYLDKILKTLKKEQQNDKMQEMLQQEQHNNQYNPKFNNINLYTTMKHQAQYIKGYTQGQSIIDSLGKLQNLKIHQYQTALDLEISDRNPKAQSQIEHLQFQNQQVQEQYFDQDLDNDQIYHQYNNDMKKIQADVDRRGNEIFCGVEHIYRQFNSNQLDKQFQQLEPNFNGVTGLDFEKAKVQFQVIPQKQQKYTDQQKEQFQNYYTNIQQPLDLLHQATDTYQQARLKEQEQIENQYRQQSLFQIGQLPKPLFFINKYTYYQKDNEKPIYHQSGNQHQDLKLPDKDLQKRYRYQNILSNIDDANERFRYKFQ